MKLPFKEIKKYSFVIWYILSICLLVGFFAIFEDVILEKAVPSTDYTIVNIMYSLRTPLLTIIMKGITFLGDISGVGIFLVVVFLTLIILKKYKYILPILMSSIAGEVFVFFMKLFARRERPSMQNALITETDFSFPSGHAMIAVTVYLLTIYFLLKACKKKWEKVVLLMLGVILVLGIGLSRLYLGVHWPTDIVASYLLGGSLVCFLIGSIEGKEYIKRLINR